MKKSIKKNKGFALLVSIVITSMLVIISFVVANIALKQLILANSNQESQYAFYNADSGIECAVYWDFKDGVTAFDPLSPLPISCSGQTVTPTVLSTATTTFTINLTKGCVTVQVGKHANSLTIIDSRGYNTCVVGAIRKLERGTKLSYQNSGSGVSETVWLEDSTSAALSGATLLVDNDAWTWVSSSPTPYSGVDAHRSNIYATTHQHYFQDSANPLVIDPGDSLFVYVYLSAGAPPTQIEIQWRSNSSGWAHRAFWSNSGVDVIGFGVQGTNSLRYMGPLPATGVWVKLSVPASDVGLEGETINGISFTLYGGRVTWDRAGKES